MPTLYTKYLPFLKHVMQRRWRSFLSPQSGQSWKCTMFFRRFGSALLRIFFTRGVTYSTFAHKCRESQRYVDTLASVRVSTPTSCGEAVVMQQRRVLLAALALVARIATCAMRSSSNSLLAHSTH